MPLKKIIGHKKEITRLFQMKTSGRIHQALLFTGLAGTGKRKIAELFLSSLSCLSSLEGGFPCGKCVNCLQFQAGTFPDLIVLPAEGMDKIPIGNPQKKEYGSVRWLIDRMTKRPVTNGYAVIIDSCDTIAREGQNALLKTIEEPPAGTHMVLISANRSSVLPTIRSRCSEMAFGRLSTDDVLKAIRLNGMSCDDEEYIAVISGGSARNAQLLSNREFYSGIETICREISEYIESKNPASLNFSLLQKEANTSEIFLITSNIFRQALYADLTGDDELKKKLPARGDRQNLIKIIKILLALNRGFSNNLNIRYSLKGLLYSIDSMEETGLPDLEFAAQN
jgi:DNA polymerase III delta prime subunit